MTKKQENKLNGFTFKGIITGTSNKVNSEFATDSPRKTAYIKVDEANKKILEDNGLTMYTSKEGDDFFIIKMAESVTIWVNGDSLEIATNVGTDNFNTTVTINIACIKGKNKGNDYVRIYAFGLTLMEDILLVEKENPFADMVEGFQPTNDDIPF